MSALGLWRIQDFGEGEAVIRVAEGTGSWVWEALPLSQFFLHLRYEIIIIIIIINEKINVAYSPKTSRTRDKHDKQIY